MTQAVLRSTPAAIKHNDTTRPKQENSAMPLRDWSSAVTCGTETIEITVIVPPFVGSEVHSGRETLRLMYL